MSIAFVFCFMSQQQTYWSLKNRPISFLFLSAHISCLVVALFLFFDPQQWNNSNGTTIWTCPALNSFNLHGHLTWMRLWIQTLFQARFSYEAGTSSVCGTNYIGGSILSLFPLFRSLSLSLFHPQPISPLPTSEDPFAYLVLFSSEALSYRFLLEFPPFIHFTV